MPTTMVDSHGRLLLSDEVRAQLGVGPGDAVEVEVDNGELRARRWVDPLGHLNPQELLGQHVQWITDNPAEYAQILKDSAGWLNIPDDLPDEEWTDADFLSEPEAG